MYIYLHIDVHIFTLVGSIIMGYASNQHESISVGGVHVCVCTCEGGGEEREGVTSWALIACELRWESDLSGSYHRPLHAAVPASHVLLTCVLLMAKSRSRIFNHLYTHMHAYTPPTHPPTHPTTHIYIYTFTHKYILASHPRSSASAPPPASLLLLPSHI